MFFDRLPGHGYVCGHRGARSLAPENTLASARAALECGADFWELDVQRTADGGLVVFHDDELARTTDVAARPGYGPRAPWPLHAFTLEELRGLDAGSWFASADPHGTVAAGEVAASALAAFGGLRIPTFRETLEFSARHGLPVNVEIKDQLHAPGDLRIVAEVHAAIVDAGMREMVLVSSFNHEYLREMRRIDPDLPLAALTEERHPDDLPGYLRDLGACGYHPDAEITDLALVRELAGRGFRVTPYTVNDMDRALALLDAGCFAVTTDFPQRLRDVLSVRR